MKLYRLMLLTITLVAPASLQARDDGQHEYSLASPCATIITHWGSLQSGNCRYKIAAKTFSQQERTEAQAIKLAVGLKKILEEKGIKINLSELPQDKNYIDPEAKYHKYQLTKALPRIYLVKVQDQWLYSEETARYVEELYQTNHTLGRKGLLKWLPEHVEYKTFFNLRVWQVVAIFLLLLLAMFGYKLLPALLKRILHKFAEQCGYDEMNALAAPLSVILLVLAFILAIPYLQLPIPVQDKLLQYAKGVLVFTATILCYRIGDACSFYIHKKAVERRVSFNLVLLPMAKVTFKVLVVIVGALFTLQILKFNIKGLLTGVGIGGLGFALASQDTIKNFFGSLVILTDKPFDVGDFIASGTIEGKVEEIGFRSTRVHTPQGSTIYVPNGKLADSHVNNYGLKQYKRFSTTIALAYNTPIGLIETFIEGLRKVAEYHPATRKGKHFIYLYELQQSMPNIIFQVNFNVTDYSAELQSRHELLVSIIKLAEALGVKFSFPTQALHVESFPEKRPFMPEYTTDPEALQQRLRSFFEEEGTQRVEPIKKAREEKT